MKHEHKPVDGTQRGANVGLPNPPCADRNCQVSGAHVIVRCECGARGVICPSPKAKRIYWEW